MQTRTSNQVCKSCKKERPAGVKWNDRTALVRADHGRVKDMLGRPTYI
jgi:hypothetical protein